MLAFHAPSHHDQADAEASNVHPWQEGHAAPEDRAVGLELQLIELVHRRDEAQDQGDIADPSLASEIASVLDQLAEIELELPAAI